MDSAGKLQIPDLSFAGPSQASVRQAGATRPASAQVYPSSAPHGTQQHGGSQSTRKRASHNVSTTQPQQEEQVGYRDVYSHPAAVAYAAAHPRRTIPKFGPYLLLQTLGEGEFGKVKLGLHCQWGEEVAVKLIRRGNIDSAVRMSKVEREIEVLRTIKHPNIVRLYDVIETDKYIGIILEYASGGELFDHILAHRYLKEKDACKLFSQLISGVWYIHQKKIVHRDLKLENLLLDRHRNVIITDFGFANRFEHRPDDLMQTSCGSPCYAAPELVISEGLYVGSAVDIWSCGVILYAMLAGYLPFDDDPANPDGDNINLLYKYIVNTPLTFPDYISALARDLLSIMLVPDPLNRADLKAIMAHEWLAPYAHLFTRSIQDLERLAMEQHQMKRLAYQKQMKQQAAAAVIEQGKLQRSQSARTDGPNASAQRQDRQHAPSAMRQDILNESSAADESLFSSPPPVIIHPSNRRHAASVIVSPTHHSTPIPDEDPFGPMPSVPNVPISQDEFAIQGELRGESPPSRKESGSKTPRKSPSPSAVAPVKMSPGRRKTEKHRERHTIQLEYEPQEDRHAAQPQQLSTPQQHIPQDTDLDESMVIASDANGPIGYAMTTNGLDVINPASYAANSKNLNGTPRSNVSVDRNGSISKATKPLPLPPSSNGVLTPRRVSSIPSVHQTEPAVLGSLDNQNQIQSPRPPIVNVAPASPPRAENVPPQSVDLERAKAGTGSVHSGGSSSSKSKHRRGMSVDKLVGRILGSGSDTESGGFINGSVKRRPSDASAVKQAADILTGRRPSTLQTSPSPTPVGSKEGSIMTEKSNEGKKSRRNTLTIMVEPISKQIRQRSKARQATTDSVPAKGTVVPVLSEKYPTKEVELPGASHFANVNSSTVNTISSSIPASTSKASKVMQWFRYRSKSRTPSDSIPSDGIDQGYENVTLVEGDRNATTPIAEIQPKPFATVSGSDTAYQQTPHVVVSPDTPKSPVVAPSMGRAQPSLASDSSAPPTPHVPLHARALGVFSNIVTAPVIPPRGTFNKNAMRMHHGAVDQTTVTTGQPPEVMARVTKVLLDMGLEVQEETDFKYRCIRAKRKKVGAGTAAGGLAAFSMVGSAASNGVDKRGLPLPSNGFSPTGAGGMLKGLLMRRQSSQVSATGSVAHSALSFNTDTSFEAVNGISSSKEKISMMPAASVHEPIYGDRTVDQGDEVRFSVELTRIDGLEDMFILDIRRLKGQLRTYKFLYDTLRERCDFPR